METKVKDDSSNEIQKYQDEWVALSTDEKRILSHDVSFKKAADRAKSAGEAKPVMIKVLSGSKSYKAVEKLSKELGKARSTFN